MVMAVSLDGCDSHGNRSRIDSSGEIVDSGYEIVALAVDSASGVSSSTTTTRRIKIETVVIDSGKVDRVRCEDGFVVDAVGTKM